MDLSLKNPEINFNSGPELLPAYQFGDFQLQTAPRLLLKHGQELPLTPKAVSTLCVLVARSGQVVSKDELMQIVWPDAIVEESNLAQYLHVLRKTLGTMPDGRPYIETLKRRGYRFNGVVHNGSGPSRNGHKLPSEDAVAPGDHAQGQRKSFAASPILIASVVIACLFVGLFAALKTDLLSGREPQKPAAEVIVTPLTSGENVTQTTISHDGKHFVYSDYDGDDCRLILQATDRSSRSEIISRFAGQIQNLSFTPDDTEVYFVVSGKSADDDGLYKISVNGGSPVKVLQTVTSPVSFSADGSKMVFVRNGPDAAGHKQVVQASLDGLGETVLLDERPGERLSPNAALSYDGRFVVFGSITRNFPIVCSLMKLNIEDRSVTALTNEEWDSCYRIAISRDDKGMAFVGTRHGDAFSNRRDQVYFLDFGSPESRRLTGDGNWHDPMSLGMTGAGEIIALPLDRISQLWAIDQDGSPATAEQITQGQSDGRGGIVSTPDGKVVFVARDGDGNAIFDMDADGQNRRRIVGSPTMQELRGSSDGSFLVYAEQQNDLTQLFRVDRNGGDRRQLTFGNSSKIDSSVSPDGRWIVYTDSATDGSRSIISLRRISAEAGTPETLSDDFCGVPHYSHDERFISCFSDNKIKVLAADTGSPVSEFTAEPAFISNTGAHWSTDDQYLVYRVVKNAATNLWRQPIKGGDPEPLTKFPKGDLYNFSYSFDGKKIYLSRGTQIRNAILIRNFR